jgi:hypothetical protein
MEYYRLYDLRNQYPEIGNYITTIPGKVNLYGIYSETNVLPIDVKGLDGIKFVRDTSFRFIANIKQKEEDTSGLLYTSEKYFKNLESSLKESNPYFVNSSLNDIFVVDVFLESFISLFESFIPKENSAGVNVLKNNFINKDKSIDYDSFVKFLDWVVSPPNLKEIDTNGVIPSELLINFTTFEIDHEKAYFYPNQPQTPATNGGASGGASSAEVLAELNRIEQIKLLQEELININSDISTYTGLIASDDYPNGGLSTSKLNVVGKIEEKEYVSGKYLLNRKKQNEDIRRQLTTYLNGLKSKKSSLELELNTLNSKGATQPNQPTEPTPTGGSYSGTTGGSGNTGGGGGNSGGSGGSFDEANNRNDGPSGREENFR